VNRCADSRKFGDWKRVLRESEAAIAVGADFSPQVASIFYFTMVYYVGEVL